MSNRYQRQLGLPGVGAGGQARLGAASVLVIGAGGLGSPVLFYLAGAGIGRLIIVDHDDVEESNLHRQPLYQMTDIGRPKVAAARERLMRFNPEIAIEARATRLSPDNVEEFVAAADVVVDAADSFATTYVLSDACMATRKPLVSASALGLSGYVGAFCGGGPSYRAVFPDMPTTAANCAAAGVLGPTVATLGALQAQFVVHLILGLAPSPLGRFVSFDAARLAFGGFSFASAPEPARFAPFISPRNITPDDLVVDLRSLEEAPVSPLPGARRLSVEKIEGVLGLAAQAARVVLCCRSGLRASQAARRLAACGISDLALVAFGDSPAPEPSQTSASQSVKDI